MKFNRDTCLTTFNRFSRNSVLLNQENYSKFFLTLQIQEIQQEKFIEKYPAFMSFENFWNIYQNLNS